MRSVWAYARYAFINAFQLTFIGFLLLGGHWMWGGLLLAGGFILLDEVFQNTDERAYAHPWILNVLLYLNLPSLLAIGLVFAYHLSAGDPLGLEILASQGLGIDLAASREATSLVHLVPAGLIVALFFGAAGINAAHELSHRTENPVDQAVARWMLALTFDTTFPIEHINGHHKNVGTAQDPATARRGEYIVSFMVRSAAGCFANAFRFERKRLTALGKPVLSPSNRALRGQAMSLIYLAVVYWLSGWTGVAVFVLIGINGKMYLEAVNYIEHYGLVRVPGRPIKPRHSWDCYNSISATFLYNLTRHADHHVNSRKPYWHHLTSATAPHMPFGYMTMILAALMPTLWHRVTAPGLAHWDDCLASEEERLLLQGRSGHAPYTKVRPVAG